MKTFIFIALLIRVPAFASGPMFPDGWGEPINLGQTQSCCIPSDLNGTGLVGGAFLFESSDGKSFAVFALTYSRNSEKDEWHLLMQGPASELPVIRMFVLSNSKVDVPYGGIVVCGARNSCMLYWLDKGAKQFASRVYDPENRLQGLVPGYSAP